MEKMHQYFKQYLLDFAAFLLGLLVGYFWYSLFVLPNGAGGWIYEYQTIIAAVVAFFPFWFAVKTYKEETKRKKLVARMTLSHALSKICSYAEACFDSAYEKKNIVPEKPIDAIDNLKLCIEYGDIEVAERFLALSNFLQIQFSRITSTINSNYRSINSQIPTLYDALKTHAMALDLFDYARGNNEVKTYREKTGNSIASSLNNVCMKNDDYWKDLKKNGSVLNKLSSYINEQNN